MSSTTPAGAEATADDDIVIDIDRVSKRFGPTLALSDVTMSVRRGRSCALLGRNGAGKSTLIAALAGRISVDSGSIVVRDAEGHEGGPGADSIAVVYQKSTLVPDLTVAENISLGTYPRTRIGAVDWTTMRARATELLGEWGIAHLVDRDVDSLAPIERKIVEICRALSRGPEVLLLDEPTAGLDEAGCAELFATIDEAKARGVTVIYVSHYLEEVFRVCDDAVILRDGVVVLTAPTSELSVAKIVDAMVGVVDGRQGSQALDPSADVDAQAPVVLAVADLELAGLAPTSLTVRAGEIVGVSGLDGAGHVRLAEGIVGLRRPTGGTVEINGGVATARPRVSDAIRQGVGFVPEDRHVAGFAPELSVEENATLTVLGRLKNRIGLVDPRKRSAAYRTAAEAWEIKASSPTQLVQELSGGNQQKVVMARALASDPNVLVLINPTAGVDVTARISIYTTIQELARRGRGVLIVSSDEVDFKIAHRVIVMFRGRIHRELGAGFQEHELAGAVQGD